MKDDVKSTLRFTLAASIFLLVLMIFAAVMNYLSWQKQGETTALVNEFVQRVVALESRLDQQKQLPPTQKQR